MNRMKDEPFVLLGVNCDDTREQARLVVEKHKIGWRSWYDGGGNLMNGPIFQRYGVMAVPTTFVIDARGIIRQRFDGQMMDFVFDQAVDNVMGWSPGAPHWLPGSTALTQLDEEVEVGRYRMRLPPGYVRERPEAGREVHRWKGPPRPDGTAPLLEVSLAPEAPAAKKLEDILEKDLEAIPCANPRLGWSCPVGPERGEIKGLTFARARWTVTESPTRKRHGYLYTAVDGDTLVRISWQDAAPSLGTPADATPLTFRKAPAK
jgi:hypothetical protein